MSKTFDGFKLRLTFTDVVDGEKVIHSVNVPTVFYTVGDLMRNQEDFVEAYANSNTVSIEVKIDVQ